MPGAEVTHCNFDPIVDRPAAVVCYRYMEGARDRLGISVLGGVALFEPDTPYTHNEQVLASLLMIGNSNDAIAEKLAISYGEADGRVDMLLEKAGTTRGGLLHTFLTSDKPVMRINRLIEAAPGHFSDRQMIIINMLVRGETVEEIARVMSSSPRAITSSLDYTAWRLRLTAAPELLVPALILSDQAGLSASLLPKNRLAARPSFNPGPEMFELDDNKWNRPGIRLLGGAAVFEWNNPFTKRQRQIASLAMLGLSNGDIGKHLHIVEDTVKTHIVKILGKAGVSERERILPGLLTADPPSMQVVCRIDPERVPFTPTQVRVGRAMLKHGGYAEIAEAIRASADSVKYTVHSAPGGLRGKAQFLTAMILSGQLDEQLAAIAEANRNSTADAPIA